MTFRYSQAWMVLVFVCLAGGRVSGEVDFNREVRPILSDRCFACHGPDADNQDSAFRVDSADNATADLGGYAGVVPGDLDASELHARIHDPDDPMPPADALKQLTESEKEILDQWILEGAKFDSHWAFKPLPRQVAVPDWEDSTKGSALGNGSESSATPDAEPPVTLGEEPIDRFIAHSHQQRGLKAVGKASRRKWLRRVTFDLTGLPPTPEEIQNYLNDTSAQAESNVVDRLLASDACAERLTSEWLDVARYSDSYGYQRDDPRYVWPYRDWVVSAFRSKMPYDQFVTWQLAGDLLPDATVEQRLATVFNRLHSHKKEGGVAIEEFRVENVADRTHTFGAAFLGLTMECCRCHDHKYDPITTEDYYSLSAFFDNVDERGLISFFTSAVPTPSMLLPTEEQQQQIDLASDQLALVEKGWREDRQESLENRFQAWVKERRVLQPMPDRVAHLSFEKFGPVTEDQAKNEVGKKRPIESMHSLENSVNPQGTANASAVTPSANRLAEGVFGNAIQLTGDDAVVLPEMGHYARHDAFSTSFWMFAPELENRAVIYRRSRGWDDAGSVGYEFTKEGDILSAKLCHFWPGDAIAVETVAPLEAKRWYHVAVTYDGSSQASGLKIYLDGKPAETRVVKDHLTRSITEWNSGYRDLAIGSRYRDRGFTNGLVDEFSLFEREISALEVAQLFDGRSLWSALAKPADKLNPEDMERLRDYFIAAVDNESKAWKKRLRDARAERNSKIDETTSIMVMRENEIARQTYVLRRGVYDDQGEPVDPATPKALPPMDEGLPRNRLGLARWLTDPDHPLLARVTVNRYWQMMFGWGLVRTPEDFGNQGEVPTHPELLDWLARDFVDSGWSVHRLLKQIALSGTYRQTSKVDPEQRELDPENRYLARGTNQRLSAEMIRDNALAASGLLVSKVGGPPVKPYDVALAYTPMKIDDGEKLYRRSLYTFWKRTSPAPVMMTLNTPTREVCRLRREITDTPLQALVMLNGHQFIEASRVMASRLLQRHGDAMPKVAAEAFLKLTSREPSEREMEILLKLYEEQLAEFQSEPKRAKELLSVGNAENAGQPSPPVLAAVTILVNSIMNLDECVRHQ